jgi:pimeloyl-ACP methyl ester carboxylesterase
LSCCTAHRQARTSTRNLIPALADRYHVIAPDYPGFGHSDVPSVDEFSYTFDNLADHVDALLDHLGLQRYAIYVQDYGAPVGWRLALRHPERIAAVISQNGNAYVEGFFGDLRAGRRLAFARDLPKAEIDLLDGGHFLLESRLTEVVALIRPFLEQHLAQVAESAFAS